MFRKATEKASETGRLRSEGTECVKACANRIQKHSRERFIRRFSTISYALYGMASANTLFYVL